MKEKIKQLIEEELARANEKFPPFASAHEGAAVLLEEIEEAELDLEAIKNRYSSLWDSVKENDPHFIKVKLETIRQFGLTLAAEAIQVAAMARKFEQFLEKANG